MAGRRSRARRQGPRVRAAAARRRRGRDVATDGGARGGQVAACEGALDFLRARAVCQQRLQLGEERQPGHKSRRCAFLEGFSLHADTWVHQHDREGLERLANYGAREPLSLERLTQLTDGRLSYWMKRPSSSGTTTLEFTPVDFLSCVAALIPPPRASWTAEPSPTVTANVRADELGTTLPAAPSVRRRTPDVEPLARHFSADLTGPDGALLDDFDEKAVHLSLKLKSSIDTHEPKRDEHLRSADFFDVKSFPHDHLQAEALRGGGRRQLPGHRRADDARHHP